ncbi:MAG: hypothetical protein OER77_16700 [Myxococcales bacterium]|nr:hypothetical protein [Myxococcales bacterium]
MRAIIVVVFVVGAFAAGLVVTQINPVAAERPPKRNQWQYQCFEASGVAQVTERSNKMGEQGWELVTSAGSATSTLWCFKRPLWKK